MESGRASSVPAYWDSDDEAVGIEHSNTSRTLGHLMARFTDLSTNQSTHGNETRLECLIRRYPSNAVAPPVTREFMGAFRFKIFFQFFTIY